MPIATEGWRLRARSRKMSPVPTLRGFVLQASYRVVTQQNGDRVPVIHVHGRLESGGTFLIRDDRQRASFYIRAADAARARVARAPEIQTTDKRTFSGEAVGRIEVEGPPDVPAIRDRLHAAGVDTFEADVRFAVRYLIERGVKGGCEIEGNARPGDGVTWVFDNPTLRPADVKIEPRVLSFDIETDGRSDKLLAISLYAYDAAGEVCIDEVLIVDGSEREMPEKAIRCSNEYAALEAFCERIRGFDPDVITGWNIIDFDLTVLQKIAMRVKHPFVLGREPGALRVRKAEGYFGSGQATIPGRLVLDGIDLLRGAFVRMEEYSLDGVAREVLGEGKAVASRSAGLCVVRPHRCTLGPGDRAKAGRHSTGARTQPVDGNDARSRRCQHCLVRFSIPHRTRTSPHRCTHRAFR
jgi:DNA polymerase-2